MSTKPPVPSRNALQVLRRLAFSSSTVLGAVGGVCGLATLNHEARRRVKLAERIVATKTTLRSVSNGRGQTHVARMCEAAERGDDFTLDENKAHKRRRVRHQSTLAFDQWNGNDGDILALQHSLQRASHQPGLPSSELQHSAPDKLNIVNHEREHRILDQHILQSRMSTLPPLKYQRLSETHNQFGTCRSPPGISSTVLPRNKATQGQKNSPSAERILAATQRPLKRDTYGVYARQTRQYATKSPRLEASTTAIQYSQAPALERYEEAEDGPYLEFLDGFARPQRDTPPQSSGRSTQPDHEHDSTGHDRPSSAPEARLGLMSRNAAHNVTVSSNSPSALPQGIGISFLPDDENAFTQWPGIPRLDEVLEDEFADLDDSGDVTVGQDAVRLGSGPEHESYFTVLHDATESSRHKSGPYDEIIHLQASGIHEVNSRVEKWSRAGALYFVKETDALIGTPVSISKMLYYARHQIRLLEKQTSTPTHSDILQASEKLEFLLAQTDLRALRVSFDGISDKFRKAAVLQAMTRCLDLDTPSSLIDAEILYYAFRGTYIVDATDQPCRRLISHLLNKNEESYSRAASILFPDEAAQTDDYKPSVQIPYKAASFYLSWFCEQKTDANAWVEEAWKIVSLAQQRGVPLHDRLIRAVLKSLILANQQGLAQRLLKDLSTQTNMEITFLSYGILIRGHAADGEWPSVRRILETLHSNGLSRIRPIGFSMLFQDVLQEYLRQKPLGQAYDYLIDATGSLGLAPTSTVSTTIITASLRQERYDLIQDWVEFIRQLFPTIDVGTGSAFSSWRVAQLWKERSSSCEEIESGCRAMAYGALRDPFSPAFRGVALDAVERDLRKRMSITNDLWQYPSQLDLKQSLAKMNLKDMVRFVDEYTAKHPSSNALPLRQRELFQDLLRQLQAVTRLNALFGGEIARQKVRNPEPSERRPFKPFIPTAEKQDPAEAALEDRINSSNLPARSELWSMVSNVYVGRQRRGQKAGHSILEYLIPRMTRTERMADALLMLESMYESPYVQGGCGTPFSHALLSMWLYIAVELKNGHAIANALWALVDSGIDLDTEMLLLVRIASDRKCSNKHLPDVERVEVTEECRYLMSTLQQRRWIRSGRREKDEIPRFAEFRSWEERMRTRPLLANEVDGHREGNSRASIHRHWASDRRAESNNES